jgi:hypothetical protein
LMPHVAHAMFPSARERHAGIVHRRAVEELLTGMDGYSLSVCRAFDR